VPHIGSRIGVEGVNTVMFGSDNQKVAHNACDFDRRKIKRLRIHASIGSKRKQFAKTRGVDVGWSKDRLLIVQPIPPVIVVIGEHILGLGRGDKQTECAQ
jgi:hypothetical protein